MKREHECSKSSAGKYSVVPSRDRQLQDISFETVLEKRRLDQALNAKEFALCAGVSYSTARGWFRLPGFPAFHGVVFWQDFVYWRTNQSSVAAPAEIVPQKRGGHSVTNGFPSQAMRILQEASQNR